MRRIGIDCRFGSLHAGLGRYTREIVHGLLRRAEEDKARYTLFVRSQDEEWLRGCSAEVIEAPFAHYTFAEQVRFPSLIRASGVDLFFSPHFIVPFLCPVPFVVTVHDLILHRFPNQASFLKRFAYRLAMRHAVRKARHIIAVSHATASDLRAAYGSAAASRTTVIRERPSSHYAPRSDAEVQAVLQRHSIIEPYLIYVGNTKEHKNVPFLLDAFGQSAQPDVTLVLVTDPQKNPLSTSPHVRVLGNVAEEDLPALYTGARAFVTASLYEGFCLPAVEAAACGTGTIAVDTPAVREVTAGKAILAEGNVASFAAALRSIPPVPSLEHLPSAETIAQETARLLLA